MTLILLGFKGVGKSTYGKKLSQLLKWDFIDTDQLIEKLYIELGNPHKAVSEIHEQIGEEGFRKLEARALLQLRPSDQTVIALGGGTVINPDSVNILRKIGRFIYLAKDKEEILHNFKLTDIPSYLDSDDLEHSFNAMYNERITIYESLAEDTLDTSKHNETEILAKLYEIAFKT